MMGDEVLRRRTKRRQSQRRAMSTDDELTERQTGFFDRHRLE